MITGSPDAVTSTPHRNGEWNTLRLLAFILVIFCHEIKFLQVKIPTWSWDRYDNIFDPHGKRKQTIYQLHIVEKSIAAI